MDTSAIISAAPNQYEVMLANYASIVEKTNNQLGLGINLATLAVAILSVLIAVIAIFVAFALWKNSKEQRDRMAQFFSKQEGIIKEKNENIEKIEKKFDNLIDGYEKKLKAIDKQDKKSIEQIQKDIAELRREKISAGAYLQPASGLQYQPIFNIDTIENPSLVSPISLTNLKSMICSSCGKSFQYLDDNSNNELFAIGGKTIHCAYCGAPNIKL